MAEQARMNFERPVLGNVLARRDLAFEGCASREQSGKEECNWQGSAHLVFLAA